jgi:exodeoxyribonuclease-3
MTCHRPETHPAGHARNSRSGLRIVTWNVNSVRLRLDGLVRLVRELAPDVLCLQETKVRNELFPWLELRAQGFSHHVLHGQAGYHGVAIFSKLPLGDPRPLDWCGRDDCRHLRVLLPGDIELHNLYIPAGGDLPDPELNSKFRHKLEMIEALAAWLRADRDAGRRAVLLGDLNVAPLETDVWNHRALLRVVSHTPVEVEALRALQGSLDWVDAVRRFVPPEERLYTWWSYRARDWAASDRGRRLDHIWVTPALAPGLLGACVLRDARGWPLPSDHVPVMVELDPEFGRTQAGGAASGDAARTEILCSHTDKDGM